MARMDINGYKEKKRAAESVKSQTETEVSDSKMTVKDLCLQTEVPKKLDTKNIESLRNEEVVREVEMMRQEVGRLKLDIACVKEEKTRRVNEIIASELKVWSVGALKHEIDVANEEQVLVELARIEALKECGDINEERERKANEFSVLMEGKTKKLKEIKEEIERSKELECKLALTLSDVNVLQNELGHVTKMERRVRRETTTQQELEAANKELANAKAKMFEYMTSMDSKRKMIDSVKEETDSVKERERKKNSKVGLLNTKLLKAKYKLETEKAKYIATDVNELYTVTEAAKKEKELIRLETEKTESEIDSTADKLEAAVQELEKVRLSEAAALEKLKYAAEKTMQARNSTSVRGSKITISKFEYEYLAGRAIAAEGVARKKVEAAEAWVEALKNSEKEILMKTMARKRTIKSDDLSGKSAPGYGKLSSTRRGKGRKSMSVAIRLKNTPEYCVITKRRASINFAKVLANKNKEVA